MSELDRGALTRTIRDIALAAGAEILTYTGDAVAAREKADRSPVTAADEAAERLIVEALSRATPDIAIVAEEQMARGETVPPAGGRFWLVDPLDGTREFLAGNGEFTVNIALIDQHLPVLGTVYLPAQRRLYYASGPGEAFLEAGDGAARPLAVRPAPAAGLVVMASRSHGNPRTDAYIAKLDVARLARAGSSLKFCLIAAAEADHYPRLGPTMEWDTAAGHAVLRAAGGSVRTLDGAELGYGKPGFKNPEFVARGRDA